uniref:Regulatory protein zeste n=1 Tax=Musca domestica TaxID=7370 RepID=A0A1I8MVY8_MUSDO
MDIQKETSHRKRAKHFLEEEEMLLVNLVEDHKHIIENKKSDSVAWKQKEAVWKKIEDDFAASMGLRRPWKALRDKYEVIKRKSKIELAEQKLETYRTGGGMVTCKVSTATGLENTYDSDFVVEPDYIDYSELNASNEFIEESNKENVSCLIITLFHNDSTSCERCNITSIGLCFTAPQIQTLG